MRVTELTLYSSGILQDGKAYHKWRAYGQSKTANILFSVELAERLGPKGLKSFSVHPGGVMTNLGRYLAQEDMAGLSKAVSRICASCPMCD